MKSIYLLYKRNLKPSIIIDDKTWKNKKLGHTDVHFSQETQHYILYLIRYQVSYIKHFQDRVLHYMNMIQKFIGIQIKDALRI